MGVMCMIAPLVLLVGYLFVKGLHLLSWHLLTSTQNKVLESCPAGQTCVQPGVFHAIVGTAEQVGFAVLIGVPLGILTAIFLNEIGGRFAQPVRVVVTAMSGLPAIVAGIFIYSIVVIHFGFSGFAGGLALAVLLLPTVTRGTEEVLKIVPNDLREASSALGAPQWRTVWSVVLPTARSGILTAVLLGIAVAIGETAPLLFTVFGSKVTNWNLFNGPQASLPLLIYTSVKSSQSSDVALGYTAALVLFLMVFTVFILARILGSPWLGRTVRSRSNQRMANAAARGVGGGPVN
jgi:phosphate transport system permease protein